MPIGFILLMALLWALFAFKAPFDTYGWLMLVAAGWCGGFLDGRRADGNPSDAAVLTD
jgi:hypothetical protein